MEIYTLVKPMVVKKMFPEFLSFNMFPFERKSLHPLSTACLSHFRKGNSTSIESYFFSSVLTFQNKDLILPVEIPSDL
jgi:hypothetical protein